MYLEQLEPGSKFKTESGKQGTLISVGPGTARVVWGSGLSTTKTAMVRKKGIDPKTGEQFEPKPVVFNVPAAAENIAPRTEVTRVV